MRGVAMKGNWIVRSLAIFLSADLSLTIFYTTGLAATIGSSDEIPYILGGFLVGSIIFPACSVFFNTERKIMLSALSVPLSFLSVWSYLRQTMIIGNNVMFLLSMLSVGGELFVVSFSSSKRWRVGGSIATGLASMLMLIVLLLAYAALYDTMTPLIILAAYVPVLLLIAVLFTSRVGSASA